MTLHIKVDVPEKASVTNPMLIDAKMEMWAEDCKSDPEKVLALCLSSCISNTINNLQNLANNLFTPPKKEVRNERDCR